MRSDFKKKLHVLVYVCMMTFLLIGCGGGGGGGGGGFAVLKPVSNAGTDQSVPLGTSAVTLSGAGSYTEGNETLSYVWTLVSKPTASALTLGELGVTASVVFSPDVAGEYVCSLVVMGVASGASSDPDFITVFIGDSLPKADAGEDIVTRVGKMVTLNPAILPNPKTGSLLQYQWAILSKPTGSTAALNNVNYYNPSFVADVVGDYILELRVTDGSVEFSKTPPDTVTVTALPVGENLPPVADAGALQNIRNQEKVQLDGSGSSDRDGDPLNYSWHISNVPDGSSITDNNLSDAHSVAPFFFPDTADSADPYILVLTVDDGDLWDSDTVTIWTSSNNQLPVAYIVPSATTVSIAAGTGVSLDGSGSYDPDLYVLKSYTWKLLAKPTGATATLTTNGSAAAISPDLVGQYVVSLFVTDVNDGNSDSYTVTITANP